MSTLESLSRPTPHGFRELGPREAEQLLGQVRVVDVRGADEFHGELGHIASAELVPLGVIGAAALPWDRGQPILLVCRSGARSSAASAELVRLGFRHVFNLAGGMMGWNHARLPVAA